MRRIVTGLVVSALLSATSALADDVSDYGANNANIGPSDTASTSDSSTASNNTAPSAVTPPSPGDQQAGEVGSDSQVAANDRYSDTGVTSSTASSREVTRGYLDNNIVGIQPAIGVIAFSDAFGNGTSRGAVGLTLDANVMSMVDRNYGQFFVGPQTGVIYSHLGSPTSNFLGTSPSTGAGLSDNANLLLIPADLKLGYALTPSFRISAHGGGNVTYRTVGNSLNLGSSSVSLGSSSGWRIFPNVGGDVELGFGRNVALLIRPDVTITPGDDFFTGTVGFQIGLG